MQTQVARIDLATIPAPSAADPAPLATMINNATVKAGLPLVSTFVYQNPSDGQANLILVFQSAS
jgi:hypothetical protein